MDNKVINVFKATVIVIIVIFLSSRFVLSVKRFFDYNDIYKPYKVQINIKDINVESLLDVYPTYEKGNVIQLNAIKTNHTVQRNIATVWFNNDYWLPKVKYNNGMIALYYSGLNNEAVYSEDIPSDNYPSRYKYSVFHNSAPLIYLIDLNTKQIKRKHIFNKHNKILLDCYYYKNKPVFVFEQKNSNPSVLDFVDHADWTGAKTYGKIGSYKCNYITGASILSVHGIMHDNSYIYPTLRGLYEFNYLLESNEIIYTHYFNSSKNVSIERRDGIYYLFDEHIKEEDDSNKALYAVNITITKLEGIGNNSVGEEKQASLRGEFLDSSSNKDAVFLSYFTEDHYEIARFDSSLSKKTVFRKKKGNYSFITADFEQKHTNIEKQIYKHSPYLFVDKGILYIVDREKNNVVKAIK